MCWSSTTPTCSNVRSIQHDPNTTPARSTGTGNPEGRGVPFGEVGNIEKSMRSAEGTLEVGAGMAIGLAVAALLLPAAELSSCRNAPWDGS